LANFQSHLISRIDCASQWKKELFEPHDTFPEFAAKCQLSWAKNVNEEGDAPWQIMLGSRDPLFCVFIGLAIWLEFYLGQSQGLSSYVFDFSGDYRVPQGGDKTNDFVQTRLRQTYDSGEFVAEKDGPLGSHSIRKYSSTRSRRNGASKDERDYRGRWKRHRRTSDAYDDPELPYPDAKVAGMLCPGGPCSYRIKSDSPVTEDWILEHVVPNLAASSYSTTLAKLLGKALLWTIFSEKSGWVPGGIVDRVKLAYNNLLGEESNVNPIEKRLLVITGDDATLLITEVNPAPVNPQQPQQQEQQQEQQQGPAMGDISSQTTRQLIHTILNQLNQVQTAITSLSEEREADKVILMAQIRTLNQNLRRIASQPIRQLNRAAAAQNNNNNNGGGGGVNTVSPRAELSPTPRTLGVLWQEWTDGIAGRKAARLFTREERGKVKHKYHRRKIVWDRIRLLINAGYTAQVACDRIYGVYGLSATVTAIINGLKKDIRNNTLHEDLRV